MDIGRLLEMRKRELEQARSEMRMMQTAFSDLQRRAGEKTMEIIGMQARVEELEGILKTTDAKD